MKYWTKPRVALVTGMLVVGQTAAETAIEHVEVNSSRWQQNSQAELDERLKSAGIETFGGGGVSGLPVLKGLAGDRVAIITDGEMITAACGNQMNPPLSYLAADSIQTLSVVPLVAPVSLGGDNIAGVVALERKSVKFGDDEEMVWQGGQISFAHNNNTQADTYGMQLNIGNNQYAFAYQGQTTEAESYTDGLGNKVLDTLYKATNHALSAGYRDDLQTFSLSFSLQDIPYQGFANQYMDMTSNQSASVNARYARKTSYGEWLGQLTWRSVEHEMGFFTPEKIGMMPMLTDSTDVSGKLHWQVGQLGESHWLFGTEFYRNTLDDWWPAVPMMAMMSPNDYININDGERQRLAAFAQWQSAASDDWNYTAGVRVERVSTGTGEVQPYNTMPMMGMPNMDAMAAAVFNARDKARFDNLVDASFIAEKRYGTNHSVQLGIARKNRAPNLYERYSWGRSPMATSMIGWFGDGNGYIGDIDLSAETAHSLSLTYQYAAQRTSVAANAWFSRVGDYIDAVVIGQFNRTGFAEGKRNILQFTNLDATLYGFDIDVVHQLGAFAGGTMKLENQFSWQRGYRAHDHSALYQLVPVSNMFSVVFAKQNWQSSLSWEWVGSKSDVDERRLENQTASYNLLNWRTTASFGAAKLGLSVLNLTDEYYFLPTSGVSIAQAKVAPEEGFNPLAGQGRALELSVLYQF